MLTDLPEQVETLLQVSLSASVLLKQPKVPERKNTFRLSMNHVLSRTQ